MKKLVAFFSATGTTKKVAERLANAIDADLFQITPSQPYTKGDLDGQKNIYKGAKIL